MRSALVPLALLVAMPASAQFAPTGRPPVERPLSPIAVDGRMPGPAPWREVRDVRERIDRGRDSGALSKREARRLKREAGRIDALASRYGRDGLSGTERRELEARGHILRDQVDNRRLQGGGGDRKR